MGLFMCVCVCHANSLPFLLSLALSLCVALFLSLGWHNYHGGVCVPQRRLAVIQTLRSNKQHGRKTRGGMSTSHCFTIDDAIDYLVAYRDSISDYAALETNSHGQRQQQPRVEPLVHLRLVQSQASAAPCSASSSVTSDDAHCSLPIHCDASCANSSECFLQTCWANAVEAAEQRATLAHAALREREFGGSDSAHAHIEPQSLIMAPSPVLPISSSLGTANDVGLARSALAASSPAAGSGAACGSLVAGCGAGGGDAECKRSSSHQPPLPSAVAILPSSSSPSPSGAGSRRPFIVDAQPNLRPKEPTGRRGVAWFAQ